MISVIDARWMTFVSEISHTVQIIFPSLRVFLKYNFVLLFF